MIVPSPFSPLVSRNRAHQLLGIPWRELEELADHAGRFYRPFDVRPLSGPRSSKWRHIDHPVPRLKALQRQILRRILATAHLPASMFGAMAGRDVRGHAQCHVGQSVIVTVDLRDCFPRTHDTAVFQALRRNFGCSEEIASVLTKLTTYHHRIPQGAPTSSILAQLTLLPMMERLQAVADARSLVLSSYIDDVAWSGAGAQTAIGEMLAIIAAHGHRIRSAKKRIMRADEEKRITGLCVLADRVAVPQVYIDDLHAYIGRLAERTALTTAERASVAGKVQHVKRFDERQGAVLVTLMQQLPTEVADVLDAHRFETRPCLNARRHRHVPGRTMPLLACQPNLATA